MQLLVGHQPRFVHRQADQARRRHSEYAAGIHVSGILDTDDSFFAKKQVRYQVERMLGADGDQDLIGGCPHAAPGQQTGVNLFQELRVVAVDAVFRPSPNGADAECLARAFPPVRNRKEREIALAVNEWIGILEPVLRLDDLTPATGRGAKALAPVGSEHVATVGLSGFAADAAREDVLIDVVAAAFTGDKIAFVHQMLVGENHGIAGHAQLLRELSARGHRASRNDVATEYGAHHHLPELALETRAAFRRQVE